MTTTTAVIDTAKVQRRAVHFNSIDDALRDVERLAQAERDGRLERLGNWTLGQAIGHLATWGNFAFDGTPLQPPWFIKLILRTRKKKYLSGMMPAGVRIPRVENGTLGVEVLSTDEALVRYRAVMERLRREMPEKPNVIFGKLTHQEWIALQLRHSELHLGFFREK